MLGKVCGKLNGRVDVLRTGLGVVLLLLVRRAILRRHGSSSSFTSMLGSSTRIRTRRLVRPIASLRVLLPSARERACTPDRDRGRHYCTSLRLDACGVSLLFPSLSLLLRLAIFPLLLSLLSPPFNPAHPAPIILLVPFCVPIRMPHTQLLVALQPRPSASVFRVRSDGAHTSVAPLHELGLLVLDILERVP